MSTIHRSRRLVFVIVAILAFALVAPVAVHAEDEVVAAEDLVITAEEQLTALAPVAGPSGEDLSGYSALEANRVLAAHQGLLSPDLGSMQEEVLLALVAASGTSWGEASGYNAVEANRVAASTWLTSRAEVPVSGEDPTLAVSLASAATWGETSGYNALEANRVAASGLMAQPSSGTDAAISDEDELLAQFRAVELSLSRYLGAEQQLLTCNTVN